MTPISIHTFEIRLETNKNELSKFISHSYKMAKKNNHKAYELWEYPIIIDEGLRPYGIKIEYCDYVYTKSVKLRVNPSKLLGGDDVVELWEPDDYNIAELIEVLDNHISDYFGYTYGLSAFRLNRVDFTANVNVSEENVPEYIKVLHKQGRVMMFSPKHKKPQYASGEIDKNLSFGLKGKTNGTSFSAYDKAGSLQKEPDRAVLANGILRLEWSLLNRVAIERILARYANLKGLTIEEEIEIMASKSKDIFMEKFSALVPRGDYYRLENAENLVIASGLKNNQKKKMLRLLNLIPIKKSLYLALRELNVRNSNEILELFAKINVSPVTISKRQTTDYLESLYNYLPSV